MVKYELLIENLPDRRNRGWFRAQWPSQWQRSWGRRDDSYQRKHLEGCQQGILIDDKKKWLTLCSLQGKTATYECCSQGESNKRWQRQVCRGRSSQSYWQARATSWMRNWCQRQSSWGHYANSHSSQESTVVATTNKLLSILFLKSR